MKRVAIFLFVASLSAYAFSFLLPVYSLVIRGEPGEANLGWDAFMVTFFGLWHEMFGGPVVFLIWLANPAFVAAAILFVKGRNSSALVLSVTAMILGSWFLFNAQVLFGYYVWLGSMPLLAVACVAQRMHFTPSLPTESPRL